MLADARGLLGDALRSYSRHSGRMLAAAVAFSALLSIAPMLYLALAVSGIAISDQAGRASVIEDLARWIGDGGAQTIDTMLAGTSSQQRTGVAAVLAGAVLLYASTRLFSQMKRALNHMWDIHAKSARSVRGKLWKQVRKRGLALVMVGFVGVLIIAAVIVKTALAVAGDRLGALPSAVILRGSTTAISLATTTVMFAVLFKVLPDARIAWRDAWRGALVTSVLFELGTTLIAMYLGHKSLDVLYGPGGSIVLLLLWVHYSAQVFFVGAAITGELARRRGAPIEPNAYGDHVLVAEQL